MLRGALLKSTGCFELSDVLHDGVSDSSTESSSIPTRSQMSVGIGESPIAGSKTLTALRFISPSVESQEREAVDAVANCLG